MFRSLKHRFVVVACAATSLLPNFSRVSFLGARAVPSIVTEAAQEETVATETAEAVGTGTAGVATRTAVGIGAAAVAGGGVAVERDIGGISSLLRDLKFGGTAAADGQSAHAATDAEEIVQNAWREPKKAEFRDPLDSTVPEERLPVPQQKLAIIPAPDAVRTVTGEAVAKAGFHVYSSSESLAVNAYSDVVLRQASDDVAAAVVQQLAAVTSPSNTAMDQAFQVVFESIKPRYPQLHWNLDPPTGMLRVWIKTSGDIVTAEFNAYTAVRNATMTLAALTATNPAGDLSTRR